MLIDNWFIAYLHDVVDIARDGEYDTKSILARVDKKHPAVAYLKNGNLEQMLLDSQNAILSISGQSEHMANNGLALSFSKWLLNEVVDSLELGELKGCTGDTKSHLSRAVSMNNMETYHGVARMISEFLEKRMHISTVYITTPFVLSAVDRLEMRRTYPDSFVVFSTDTSLLGGVRRVMNGVITDNSWLGRVQRFVQQVKV